MASIGKRRYAAPRSQRARGFTLVELAIVIVLATLVLGAFLIPLAGQVESQRVRDARAKTEEIKEALLGFAAANGRLPCPAFVDSGNPNNHSAGRESICETSGACANPDDAPKTHGRCQTFFNGYLPAATLGISPTDSSGFALDPWGQRWRYAVTDQSVGEIGGTIVDYALTLKDGMRTATAPVVANTDLLFVCASGGGASDCGSNVALTKRAPVVIWSSGHNASSAGVSNDERENGDNDRVYVSHDITDASGPAGEFDDLVGWLSLHLLFNRMLTAGQL